VIASFCFFTELCYNSYMKYSYWYKYGNYRFTLVADEESLLCCKFNKEVPKNTEIKNTPLIDETIRQLDEYFNGLRKEFNLPLKPEGTEFQKNVWYNLIKIPYGKKISYKELADMSGNVKACRAVGMANNKNPIAIIIPCHRVIGSNGALTGYAGGLKLKAELLELEKNNL